MQHVADVLSAFNSFKLEEQRCSTKITAQNESSNDYPAIAEQVEESQHFFAKFLTNPKLLALQLSDSNFRRSVLLQCLILFQYLTSTVKFKTYVIIRSDTSYRVQRIFVISFSESHTLTKSQQDFIKETETDVFRLLEETPPNGAKFCKTVRHMLKREELWNNWKNDGCKGNSHIFCHTRISTNLEDKFQSFLVVEFKRPELPADEQIKAPSAKKSKPNLGELVRDHAKHGKSYLGNAELTRLWNLCPDNLAACRGEDRNFLPAIETYLDANKDADASFGWRALRLLARQSPHFFSLTPTSSKINEYLDAVRKKMKETKTKKAEPRVEPENDLVVEKEDVLAEDDTEMQKDDQMDDKNVHKTSLATPEQLRELSMIIDQDWKKLGAKLGMENRRCCM